MEAVHHPHSTEVPQVDCGQSISHVRPTPSCSTLKTNLHLSNGPDSLPWINEFISSCPECKFDFLDVHYYWTYEEFKGEIEMWHKRFPHKDMWVSDIGFQSYSPNPPECQKDDKKCVPMIKKMVKWMDKTRYIKRYTFRGEFRTDGGREAHQPLWSFINDNGGYTNLGKWYLGIGK